MRTNCGPLWLMVQLFSRQRRLVFGTASVPIISIANIYVMEAKNTRIRVTGKLITRNDKFFSTIALAKVVNMISSFAISPTARVLLLHGNHSRLTGLKVHVHRFPIRRKIKASEIPFWETEANYFDGNNYLF